MITLDTMVTMPPEKVFVKKSSLTFGYASSCFSFPRTPAILPSDRKATHREWVPQAQVTLTHVAVPEPIPCSWRTVYHALPVTLVRFTDCTSAPHAYTCQSIAPACHHQADYQAWRRVQGLKPPLES